VPARPEKRFLITHRFEDPAQPIFSQGGHMRRIVIGRDCYLGMGVCVLGSADIGEGSVVGAGAVVVRPVPPFTVVAGVPARAIRRRGGSGGTERGGT
jgi:acetyltransferase-like isoleucine patch superfamily enzyme